MSDYLNMEMRSVNESKRLIIGTVAPYDETTYMIPDPAGERIRRGAFKRSIDHKRGRLPLFVNHNRDKRMGESLSFQDTPEGLLGEFRVNEGADGDALLEECRNGYYGGLSACFRPVHRTRAADGAQEITEAELAEVSVVGHPAYEGAGMLSVRNAQDLDRLLAPFTNRPEVNLEPLPRIRYGSR